MSFVTWSSLFTHSFWVLNIAEKARKFFFALHNFSWWYISGFLQSNLVKTDSFNFTASALILNLGIFYCANILVQLTWVTPWSTGASILPHQTSSNNCPIICPPGILTLSLVTLGRCPFAFHYKKIGKTLKLGDKRLLEQLHMQNNSMLFPVYIQCAVC